jgi:hypothetical protein
MFLESVKEQLRSEYEYILIDSRTGVSDSAGICTIQMPDVLVIGFAMNRQNIEGAAAVAESVREQRSSQSVRILPVPMRMEIAEKEALQKAMELAHLRFHPVLSSSGFLFPSGFLEEIAVPYIPYYSYLESLSVFVDHPSSRISLLASIERLTAYVTDGEVTRLVPASAHDSKRVLALYGFSG